MSENAFVPWFQPGRKKNEAQEQEVQKQKDQEQNEQREQEQRDHDEVVLVDHTADHDIDGDTAEALQEVAHPAGQTMLLDGLNHLTEQVAGLQTKIGEELRLAERQEKIADRLHAELQEYKRDQYANYLKPLIMEVIEIRESLVQQAHNSKMMLQDLESRVAVSRLQIGEALDAAGTIGTVETMTAAVSLNAPSEALQGLSLEASSQAMEASFEANEANEVKSFLTTEVSEKIPEEIPEIQQRMLQLLQRNISTLWSFIDELGDILERYDVEIYQAEPGEAYTPLLQRVVKKQTTEDDTQHGLVHKSYGYGYKYCDKVVYPQRVDVYVVTNRA